jgi:capsular polysaccharide transport system ATP-binding protein
MLRVKELAKRFYHAGVAHTLFDNLTFDLAPGEHMAVLGRNGQGKSTLVKLLGGVNYPSAGTIDWTGRCSWPLGFTGGVLGGMSGMDNIRFLARIYRQPFEGLAARVDDFAELGDALAMPIRRYSTGMRARLSFGISLAIEFDCYLIDEVISVGDAPFQEKCRQELFKKRADRGFIIATHDLHLAKQTCTRGIVVEGGRAYVFDDIGEAIDEYQAMAEEHRLDEALKRSTGPRQDFSVTQLDPGEVKLQAGAVERVEITASGERRHCPPGVFRSHERPNGRCPNVFDLAGPARNLFFGPYFPLTPGKWRVCIDLELDAEAAGKSFTVEFGIEPEFTQAKLPLGASGPLRIEIVQDIETDGLGQIRLWLKRAAHQGRVRFFGATVEQIGALETAETSKSRSFNA